MKKKVILSVVLAVVVALSTVFAVLNIHVPGELSIWQKKEIEHYWGKNRNEAFLGWYDDVWYGMKYYTSENGFLILFAIPEFYHIFGEIKTIAEYNFEWSHGFYLFAFKDGVFYNLEDAYLQGFISENAIAAAHRAHLAHIDAVYKQTHD